MKRQWKRMKQKKSGIFNFDLCFHCQKKRPVGFWFYCETCLKIPEIAGKMAYINKRLREKYGGLEFGDH